MVEILIAAVSFGFGFYFGKNQLISRKPLGLPVVSSGPKLFTKQQKRKPVFKTEQELWEIEQASRRST